MAQTVQLNQRCKQC